MNTTYYQLSQKLKRTLHYFIFTEALVVTYIIFPIFKVKELSLDVTCISKLDLNDWWNWGLNTALPDSKVHLCTCSTFCKEALYLLYILYSAGSLEEKKI